MRGQRCPSSGCRHLLPVNGQKDAVVDHFANHQRCKEGGGVPAGFFLPVYGEKCPAGQ